MLHIIPNYVDFCKNKCQRNLNAAVSIYKIGWGGAESTGMPPSTDPPDVPEKYLKLYVFPRISVTVTLLLLLAIFLKAKTQRKNSQFGLSDHLGRHWSILTENLA